MTLKIGLVGLPNKGKSSFFKAATLKDVEIANYPFTTIKPNVGVGFVKTECPCKELNVTCSPRNSKCENGFRMIPVELVDVAGLVEGAHEGKGMGNQFLDDLRQADALIQVIDISGKTDNEGKSVVGFGPAAEIEILENEIDLWLFGILKKNWDKFARLIAMQHRKPEDFLSENLSGFGVSETHIMHASNNLNLDLNSIKLWSEGELKSFAIELRRASKPIIIAANKVDVPDSDENLKKLQEAHTDKKIIPTSAESELALKNAAEHGLIKYASGNSDFESEGAPDEKQRNALDFIKKSVLEKYGSTGIQKCLNSAVFDILDKIVVYPVENENKYSDKHGNVLPDAFLIKNGSTALDLAYKVHTDIGGNFIHAVDARTKQRIGKDYVLKNRDVIKIVSAAR